MLRAARASPPHWCRAGAAAARRPGAHLPRPVPNPAVAPRAPPDRQQRRWMKLDPSSRRRGTTFSNASTAQRLRWVTEMVLKVQVFNFFYDNPWALFLLIGLAYGLATLWSRDHVDSWQGGIMYGFSHFYFRQNATNSGIGSLGSSLGLWGFFMFGAMVWGRLDRMGEARNIWTVVAVAAGLLIWTYIPEGRSNPKFLAMQTKEARQFEEFSGDTNVKGKVYQDHLSSGVYRVELESEKQ